MVDDGIVDLGSVVWGQRARWEKGVVEGEGVGRGGGGRIWRR